MILIDKLDSLKKVDPIVKEYIDMMMFGFLYCDEEDLDVDSRLLLNGLLSIGTNTKDVELDKLFLSEFDAPYGDIKELDISNIEYNGPKFINTIVGSAHVVVKYENNKLIGTVYNTAE